MVMYIHYKHIWIMYVFVFMQSSGFEDEHARVKEEPLEIPLQGPRASSSRDDCSDERHPFFYLPQDVSMDIPRDEVDGVPIPASVVKHEGVHVARTTKRRKMGTSTDPIEL